MSPVPGGSGPNAANQLRTALLLGVLMAGSFHLGRLSERRIWPCRLRPLAPLLEPLLAEPMPSTALCELLLQLPG